MRVETSVQTTENITIFLFQAVRELLFNVVKHSGADRAWILLDQTGDGRSRLTVADTGKGFDPQVIAAAGQDGEGLGLFGIWERLEHLGGELRIESNPGGGTRIAMTAPLDLPSASSALAASDGLSSADGGSQHTAGAVEAVDRVRILLVDDHHILREGLAKLLRDEPEFEIAGEAADGWTAVELAGHLRPDVVLMDVSLPHLNGVEATRIIKRERPETVVIGLSIHDEYEIADAMRGAGASVYLPKGGPSDELCRAIRRAVGSRALAPLPSPKARPARNR